MKIIAYYLPQFHPIPENDRVYGKGFTEWTNAAKAKPLFPGHYQPHIPADLGFYDLRLVDTIESQVTLAKTYGVDSFCYWHYWFGNNKQILEKPFNDIVKNKDIDFSFCLGWDNRSWLKKWWLSNGGNKLIIKQEYGGMKDYTSHFYSCLEGFKDKRYTSIDGKLFFAITHPLDIPDINVFMETWRKLAKYEKIDDFYFVAIDPMLDNKDELLKIGFDAIIDSSALSFHRNYNIIHKSVLYFLREILKFPTIFSYKEAIKHCISSDDKHDNIIPLVFPNWDTSPRNGGKSFICNDSNPKEFEILLRKAFDAIINKPNNKQCLIIQSWNEWGEGNHLEPDLKFGTGYLEAIKKVREEYNM